MQWASGAGAAAVGPLLDWVRKDASVDLAPHSAPLLYMIALVALRVSQDVDIPLQLEPVADVKFALWCSVHASQRWCYSIHAEELFPDLCIRAPSLEIGQSLWFALEMT